MSVLLLLLTALSFLATAQPASASLSSTCQSGGYTCVEGGYNSSTMNNNWATKYYGAGGGVYIGNPPHNCTLYAAWMLAAHGAPDPGGTWGNARDWGHTLASMTNGSPAVGSIAWYDAGRSGIGSFGHVGYVAQVNLGNGTVFIESDNYLGGSAGYTSGGWVSISSPSGYIHVRDLPSRKLGEWNRYNNGDHSALTGNAPAGATFEGTLGVLMMSQDGGTGPIFSCNVGGDEFTSLDSNCEGQHVNGLLGYIYSSQPSGVVTRPIYRCTVSSNGEHFDSPESNCEGQHFESRLGYVLSYTAWNRYNNGDHSALTGNAPAGATFEGTLGYLMQQQAGGTGPIFSCNFGGDEFTSLDSNCEGQHVNGLLGYIYSLQPSGVVTRPIYRCTVSSNGEHFDSPESNCEGQHFESRLGYVLSYG